MRILLIGLGSLALAAVYICALMWLIGWLTGWRALARRFPATAVPRGPVYSWLSLRIGPIGGYNNALTATLCEEGIHLLPILAFRLGHPPILFPWSVAEPMREAKAFGVMRWIVPLRVDERSLELVLPEAARPFVDAHVARKNDAPRSPFSSGPSLQ